MVHPSYRNGKDRANSSLRSEPWDGYGVSTNKRQESCGVDHSSRSKGGERSALRSYNITNPDSFLYDNTTNTLRKGYDDELTMDHVGGILPLVEQTGENCVSLDDAASIPACIVEYSSGTCRSVAKASSVNNSIAKTDKKTLLFITQS